VRKTERLSSVRLFWGAGKSRRPRLLRKLCATVALTGFLVTASCEEPPTAPARDATAASQGTSPTLEEQKTCADQADKSFKESRFSDGHSTFADHYDPKVRACYIEIATRRQLAKNQEYDLLIYDAFERRVYGQFASTSANPKAVQCSVKPRGQAEVTCGSDSEFNDLALRYFGTAAD
jgi:hypothetical protein